MPVRYLAGLPVAILILALVTACEPAEDPAPPEPESLTPSSEQEEPAQMASSRPPSLQDVIDRARADLSERLDITAERIQLNQAREVVWRDGARGCPEEDMMYTQALVEGYLVKLEADGKVFAYHAGNDGVPFLCPADRQQAPLEDDRQRS